MKIKPRKKEGKGKEKEEEEEEERKRRKKKQKMKIYQILRLMLIMQKIIKRNQQNLHYLKIYYYQKVQNNLELDGIK